MCCVDVNVLVDAHRADLPGHDDYGALIEWLANDDEPLGLPDLVLSGFLRVMTNHRGRSWIVGSAGVIRSTSERTAGGGVERLSLDAKSLMIYAGSNEVQVTRIAEGLLNG